MKQRDVQKSDIDTGDILKFVYSGECLTHFSESWVKKDIITYKDAYLRKISLKSASPYHTYKTTKDLLLEGVWSQQNPLFRLKEYLYFKYMGYCFRGKC